jgi:hypothetical protein
MKPLLKQQQLPLLFLPLSVRLLPSPPKCHANLNRREPVIMHRTLPLMLLLLTVRVLFSLVTLLPLRSPPGVMQSHFDVSHGLAHRPLRLLLHLLLLLLPSPPMCHTASRKREASSPALLASAWQQQQQHQQQP